MSKEHRLARPQAVPLMRRPQRLGILPTMDFWNDEDNFKRVGWLVVPLTIWVVVLSHAVLPFWASPLVAAAFGYVALGVLELGLRMTILRRRRELAVREKPAELTGSVLDSE